MDETRVDRWLWAVRLFKTRSMAQRACQAGHVQVNGRRAKPATTVRIGDTVQARTGDRQRVVEVTQLIDTRVSASVARGCLIDHSPAPAPPEHQPSVPRRERGAGRPTKRERRLLEREWGSRRP